MRVMTAVIVEKCEKYVSNFLYSTSGPPQTLWGPR